MKSLTNQARIASAAALICALLATGLPAFAQDYDLVILNGCVMDPETGYDAVANVGVKNGRIAVITKDKITGKKAIDATGHVVAPGFIDTHNHWQRTMGYKIALRDGVTTSFDLEYGTVGTHVAEWYAERKGKTQMNYGTASSHEGARSLILDQCPQVYDAPTALPCRAKFKQVTDATEGLYTRAAKFGVKLGFGSDLLMNPPSENQGAQLARLGKWFSPYEVLKIATSQNAELLELSGPRHPYREGRLGVIAEGAYADLILVDGNPLDNLDLVADSDTNFKLIMKNGVIYKNTL